MYCGFASAALAHVFKAPFNPRGQEALHQAGLIRQTRSKSSKV